MVIADQTSMLNKLNSHNSEQLKLDMKVCVLISVITGTAIASKEYCSNLLQKYRFESVSC